jgi:hypothetical protein
MEPVRRGVIRGGGELGGNKGLPRAASEDSEEVGEVDEGVVEVAAS